MRRFHMTNVLKARWRGKTYTKAEVHKIGERERKKCETENYWKALLNKWVYIIDRTYSTLRTDLQTADIRTDIDIVHRIKLNSKISA